ncbi:MAG TPA: hypothetical protein DCY17_04160 [Clostridiales bacterium]|nr:hypothetical protein [Clostridiales bacterium]
MPCKYVIHCYSGKNDGNLIPQIDLMAHSMYQYEKGQSFGFVLFSCLFYLAMRIPVVNTHTDPCNDNENPKLKYRRNLIC